MTDRRYLASHPWLKFGAVDLSAAPYSLWMLLGEASSKVEHLRGVPLRPEAQLRLHEIYLAKGAWATAQIEGNTLTEDEVRSLLEGGLELPPSREYQAQEIRNIVAAVNDIANVLDRGGPQELTPELIADYNKAVLAALEVAPGVVPGAYREGSVGVGPYLGAPAEDVEFLSGRLCEWLGSNFNPPEDSPDLAFVFSLVKAILAHLYFEWIHPFGDGNGRTGRLIEFHVLVSSGVPFPAAHLLSNHYNLTRPEYYRQLHLASLSGGDYLPFLSYAVQGLVDGLRAQIGLVQGEQVDVMWENYVHQMLPGGTESAERRRTLVFELSRQTEPTLRSNLMKLTPGIAVAYARKTPKTLTRDLNLLRKLGLIRPVSGQRLTANKELMQGFLPRAVAGS